MRLPCSWKWPQAAMPDEKRLPCPYPRPVEAIRKEEYPLLQDTIYLDHAGTTPYPRSLMESFATNMISSLLGNPHSKSPSSMLSTDVIESTRLQALAFFKADPEHFDLIFVANATAAIKLVMDCMFNNNQKAASWYGYHVDSHTSLVGVRETAGGTHQCFKSDKEVDKWIRNRRSQTVQDRNLQDSPFHDGIGLFAYPAQSNMNGRRLPLSWSGGIRCSNTASSQVFTLLDAAAYVSTAQLDLSDPANAPDFTALSFYKIFGFPDLGALIVRKASGHVLSERRYFAGGTVDMVINDTTNGTHTHAWHAMKSTSLHEMLEDGTPAFHSILALSLALKAHQKSFGSMENISKHTCNLIATLYDRMSRLSHANGLLVCKIYEGVPSRYGTSRDQGPTIAFNVRDSSGEWIGKSDFERLAILNKVQLRTGGVCNPGGIASALDMSPREMRDNFDEGLRCGNELDVINGKPTGIVRVSLGAMSSMQDIEKFMVFMQLFVDTNPEKSLSRLSLESLESTTNGAAHLNCPVAACVASFKTRDLLWAHLSVHSIGNAGTKATSKKGARFGMRISRR